VELHQQQPKFNQQKLKLIQNVFVLNYSKFAQMFLFRAEVQKRPKLCSEQFFSNTKLLW